VAATFRLASAVSCFSDTSIVSPAPSFSSQNRTDPHIALMAWRSKAKQSRT
jgi:hypothetical protein